MEQFASYFGEVEDPRASNARHDLIEVMFIAMLATLCGAEDCTDMAAFARAKLDFLRPIIKLEHGPPSHDTFSRVFRRLRPEPFEAAFTKFTAAFCGALQGVVAIDGKAVRGAYARGHKSAPLHLVNVWAAEARLVIGQRLAPGRNEVLGAQQALALLQLDGCIVTADALHCRADTARIILDTGADYALAVKANQPTLLAKAKALIERADPATRALQPPTKAHDRIESRTAIVVPVSDSDFPNSDFPGIAAVACVETHSKRAGTSQPTIIRFFLLSTILSAERMIEVAQTHWTIENQLHWVLDVDLNEDAARSRCDHAPQNLALIRKLALDTLRQHPDKASIKTKIKRAAWNNNFLLSLLNHMR